MKSEELTFDDINIDDKDVNVEGLQNAKRSAGFDWQIFTLLMLLVAIGIVITPSAGYFKIMGKNYSYTRYLIDHFLRVFIGLTGGFIFYVISPKKLIKARFLFIGLSLFFLLIVLKLSPFKFKRWMPIGPFLFQPSEFTKVAVLLYIAGFAAKGRQRLKSLRKSFLYPMLIVFVNVALIIAEPNISTSILIVTIATAQLFIGGLRFRYVLLFILLAVGVIGTGVVVSKNARERLQNFIHQEQIKPGKQVYYARQAIKNGGLLGVGIGKGEHKFFYLLRQADTDFVYAVIGEEMGFVGAFAVIVIYLLLFLLVLLKIKSFADDMAYAVLAFGIVFTFLVYALINISTSLGFIPATGVPLPFISYGGSSMLANMTMAGILLRILKEKNEAR